MARKATRPATERVPSGRVLGQEIQEDLHFQVRSWKVQRLGWWAGVVVFAIALSGLLGGGPLSTVEEQSEDGRLAVTYERFARHGTSSQIVLRLDPTLAPEGTATLWIDREYLDGLVIEGVTPEPARVLDGDGRTGYEFEVDETASEGLDVTFTVEYDDIFVRHGAFMPEGAAAVRVSQVVYP